jgi:hypothetical protein
MKQEGRKKNSHSFFSFCSLPLQPQLLQKPTGGLAIGISTEYFTSNRYSPVQDVADACRTGAATDIIFGLALGYKSTIVPCFCIAAAIFVSFSLASMYGIACAALGMLTTLSTGLVRENWREIFLFSRGFSFLVRVVLKRTEKKNSPFPFFSFPPFL